VLELLAAQAAISLENAASILTCNRRTASASAEEALRRSEAYLAKAQRLSHTGITAGIFPPERSTGQKRLIASTDMTDD